MRLLVILLMFGSLSISAKSFSQTVTYKGRNVSLEKVLAEIQQQTGYSFFYNDAVLKKEDKVSVSFDDTRLEKVLGRLLKDKNFSYSIQGKTIFIYSDEDFSPSQSKNFVKPVDDVHGIVKDSTTGEPLAGVTIKVKNSTKGTTSDDKGQFDLQDVPDDAVLVVSYLGYGTKEVAVKGRANLNILLSSSTMGLSQLVVTALGIKQQSRDLSYEVQEIKGDAVNKVKDANFINSLQGKVAGVTIKSSASGVGGGVRVVMRGAKSLFGNNNALYVIDGVPMPSLNQETYSTDDPTGIYGGRGFTGDGISNLNPDDIESISILSGPSAAALYGSAAANGVINITTKKGAEGGLRLNVYNNSSFLSPFILPKLQKTYGPSTEGAFDSWGNKLSETSTYNPRKDFFQTGQNITTGFDLSGGTKKNQTYFSGALVGGKGIIPNNKMDRYNFTIRNTTSFLDDKLNLDLSAMYVKVKEQNMLSQGQYSNPLFPIYLFPAGYDITAYQLYERYDPVRNFKTQFWPFGDMGYSLENPYWITNRELFTNGKNRYLLSAKLKYSLTSWLDVIGRVNYDANNVLSETKLHASTSGIYASPAGNYLRTTTNAQQIYSDILLKIDRSWTNISLNATFGASIKDNQMEDVSFGGNLGQVANLFTYNNVIKSSAKYSQSSSHLQKQAVFANVSVGYNNYLFLNLSGRNDWSSTLANTDFLKKGFFYPSVGVSAIITDMADIHSDVLSFLKVRGSISSVGNALTYNLSTGQLQYGLNTTGVQTTTYRFLAPLKPERTKSYEIGINSRFIKDHINLNVTLYKSNTYNQLFTITAPQSSGYTNFYANAGNVQNKGIEAMLGYNGYLGPVKWNSSVTFSLNKNKIKEMLPPIKDPSVKGKDVYYTLDSLTVAGTGSFENVIQKGGEIGDFYVNKLRTDNQGNIYVDPGSGNVTPLPNQYIFAGNATPRYHIGFSNEFHFKGFDLSFLINGRFGGEVVSQTQAVLDAFGASQTTADARDNGGVTVNNAKITNVEDYYKTVGGSNGILSQYVYKATNIRLGEVYLGYSLPSHVFNHVIRDITVGITAKNLFMFYNKAPFDPESTASTGTYYQGINYFMQPSLRSIGFSIKVSL